MFADDTTLHVSHRSIETAESYPQTDLDYLMVGRKNNRLVLNVLKAVFTVIRSRQCKINVANTSFTV